jgi:hypothetical protein
LGTGAKASGAIMHLNSHCSWVNMKFAVAVTGAKSRSAAAPGEHGPRRSVMRKLLPCSR